MMKLYLCNNVPFIRSENMIQLTKHITKHYRKRQKMIISTNITNTESDVERFGGESDVRAFCLKHRLDGFELLPYFENTLGVVPEDLVSGVHLSYYNAWVDFWNGDTAAVIEEFGDIETAKASIADSPEALVAKYIAQLDFAESIGAKYVVFHVSDVTLAETVTYKFSHTDEQVIDASLGLINAILKGGNYSFYFLVENLWWPGFTFTKPDMTRRLLDGIEYHKKGIMLDTGHLLHTNNDIEGDESAVAYLNSVLDLNCDLCGYIKGVHLQYGLSGAFVKNMLANPPSLTGSYTDRMITALTLVSEIDKHEPFTAPGVANLIKRISPEFLTFEFITRSREEHEEYLTRQNAALVVSSNLEQLL